MYMTLGIWTIIRLRPQSWQLLAESRSCPSLYISVTISDNELHNQKLYTYKDLLEKLPKVNYATLKAIIGHLMRLVGYHWPSNAVG